MPTYEYHCNACDRDFEVEKRMSDPVDQTCALCGSPNTQRLISHSSFVLKGSGWYVTDYARKNGSGGSNGKTPSQSHAAGSGNGDKADSPASSGPVTSTPPSGTASKTAAPTGGVG